jgi:hypothetical protein
MDERLLQEKAAFQIVDAVAFDVREINTINALGTLGSVIRWKKQPRSLARRLLDSATGKQRQFDRLFEGQTVAALHNLRDILADVRRLHAESDLILAKTAGKVVQLHDALKSFKGEVFDIVEEMRAEIGDIKFRVDALEARAAVADAVLRLRNPDLGPLTLDRLWLEFDGLWWSEFGAVVRRDPKGKAARAVVGMLQQEVAAVLRERFHDVIEANFALPTRALLDGVLALDPARHEEFELMALDPEIALRPLTKALVNRSLGVAPDPDEVRLVPRIITATSLAERLYNETQRSTEG